MSSTSYTGAAPLAQVIPFPAKDCTGMGLLAAGLRNFELATAALERAMDFCAVVAAVLLAYEIDGWWHRTAGPAYSFRAVTVTAALFGVLLVLLLEKSGDYRPCLSLLAVRETERLLRVSLTGFLLGLPALVAVTRTVPRSIVVLAAVLVPFALAVEKWQTQELIRAMRRPAGVARKAVIVGTGTAGRRIFSALVRSPKLGIDPVAFVQLTGPMEEAAIFESSYQRKRRARVLPGPVTAKMLRRLEASVVVVADPGGEVAAEIRSEAENAGAATYVLSEPLRQENCEAEYIELDGLMLAYQVKRREKLIYAAAKRALDVSLAAVSLLLLAPVLAAAALSVKLTSPGPVIFRQKRVGRLGRAFEMYKFRTMHTESAAYARSPVYGRDPRITRVGRLLRHTCVDELPQLVNVLRGEMSLVGPRPEMPFLVEQYEAVHLQRLAVKPGITGLWQLSADRMSPIHENISYDLYYVRHRTFWFDLAILLHTVAFAFRGV